MVITTGQKPKSLVSNHSLLIRMSKTEVRKVVAARILQSRELNGYSQTEAALKFGYKNPTQLSLWEMGRRMPPLAMLVRASAVYRVSMDFLMGVSEEPDRDPMSAARMHVLNGASNMVETMTGALCDTMLAQIKTGGPTVEISYSMVNEGGRFLAAVKRFMEINTSEFEDMRGGAPMKKGAETFERDCMQPAKDMIARYERTNAVIPKRVASNDPYSRHLFDPKED